MELSRTYFIILLISLHCVNQVFSSMCVSDWYRPCGDNICCCSKDNMYARCSFWHDRQYIPKLPEPIQHLLIQYHNDLKNVSNKTFYNISTLNLQELQLINNNIETIEEDTFTSMKHLSKFDLTGNNKLNASSVWRSLKSFDNLTIISLRDNNFQFLPDDSFSQLNKTKVTELNLINNTLRNFNFTVLKDFDSLEILLLKENKLTTFSKPVPLPSLISLFVGNNRLSQYPDNLCPNGEDISYFPRLGMLDLAGNLIRDLDPDAVRCLKHLQYLNLNLNLLQFIENNTFSDLPMLKRLQVAEMQCSLKEIHLAAFNSSSLTSLYMQQNNIIFSPLFGRKPSDMYIFDHCTSLTTLDVSQNSFAYLNGSMISRIFSPLKKLQVLFMITTYLVEIPSTFFTHFPTINKVILDGNGIQHMNGSFNGITSLRHLSIQWNNIRVVREIDFPVNLRKSLTTIGLGGNPFDCSCENLWFRNWIDSNQKKPKKMQIELLNWFGGYKCRTPSSMNDVSLLRFHPTLEECTYHNPLTSVYIVSGVVVFVTIITSLVLYKNRWYIKYVFYKVRIVKRNKNPEQCQLLMPDVQHFDGYVIYSDEDSDYVHNDLINIAEEKMKYKLHVWHRNAGSGAKIEVMVEGIYNSDNVVAVISNNFLKDSWCQFQLTVALDRQVELKRDNVLLVILEDVDLKSLSKYWCVVFTKTPSAYWCHKVGEIKHTVFEQKIRQHFDKHT